MGTDKSVQDRRDNEVRTSSWIYKEGLSYKDNSARSVDQASVTLFLMCKAIR